MNGHRMAFQGISLIAVIGLVLMAVGSVAASAGAIVGVVTAPDGGLPPVGTRVKLFEPGSWDVFGQVVVEADGSFSLGPVPQGLYVIKAVPPVGSSYTQSELVPVSVAGTVIDVGDVPLTDPEILGTVTEPDGVTPVAAEVRVYAADGTLWQVVAAPGGEIAIGGLPAGSYGLCASPVTDGPFWHSPLVPVTAGGYTQTITITLAAADVYGVVTDHLGNPVPHATVYASGLSVSARNHDTTSGTGYYAIGGLVSGTYQLVARPPWYEGALLPSAPVTFTLPPSPQHYDLTFRAPPKVVTGTVETNTGTPVLDALIVAHRLDKGGRAATHSIGDGSYRLLLSDGLWALTVRPVTTTVPAEWVYPDPPQLVHFEHNALPEHKQQDFVVLTADARVTGKVALPGGGTPTFTVTVALYNDEGIGVRDVVTPGGTGAFDVALPNGGYKVWVRPNDPGYLGPVVAPIQVLPNSVYDLGVLTLLERDAIISGTVENAAGVGVPDIPVSAWRRGAPGGAEAVTGPNGQYILSVVAGEWFVRPSPGPEVPYIYTGAVESVTITSAQTISDVDFSLVTADATISGYLVDEDGNPVTDAEGWASAMHVITPGLHNGAPIQAGAFSVLVPEGVYRVAAHLPAGSPYMSTGEKHVVAPSGSVATITLTVKEKDARIVGGLWDPRNEDVVEGVAADVLVWAGGNWVRTAVDTGNGSYALDIASGLWHVGYRVDPRSGYVGLRQHKNVPVPANATVPVPLPVVPRDGALAGTVLGPDGDPLSGAKVIADGIGPEVQNLWLTTYTDEQGLFRLPVPHGVYRLGATVGITDSIKPVSRRVSVHEGETSGSHVLAFRWPDAEITGTVTISAAAQITGTVSIWAWSEDDAFVAERVPVTQSVGVYSLDVVSNTTWHVGAVFETPTQYWVARETVVLTNGGATQDLVLTGPHPKPAPVAVTFDTMNPQRIVLADGTHIYIPAGAIPVEGRVTLRVVPIATLPHQRHANVYRYGYAFTVVDADGEPVTEHFNHDVLIGFAYTEEELRREGLNEFLLKPAYFSTTDNAWTFPESYVVDTEANVVMMQVDHFTDFALTGLPGYSVFLPVVLR